MTADRIGRLRKLAPARLVARGFLFMRCSMPYKLEKSGSGYFVVNTETGEKKSKKPISEKKAKAQMRFLYMIENKKEMIESDIPVMVAFMIPPEFSNSVYGTLSNSGMRLQEPYLYHVTLAYLGGLYGDDIDITSVIAALGNFIRKHGPISGKINGYGRFTSNEGNGENAVYANFDSSDLPEFRQCLVHCLEKYDNRVSKDHGYSPHITLGYIDKSASMPTIEIPNMHITFSEIVLAVGDDRIKFRLDGSFGEDEEEEKELKKKEPDGEHPSDHYLVVGDEEKVTTWHLPVYDAEGKLDRQRMGAAWAALHGGYRGKKYIGPKKQDAISKLTALYKKAEAPLPGERVKHLFGMHDQSEHGNEEPKTRRQNPKKMDSRKYDAMMTKVREMYAKAGGNKNKLRQDGNWRKMVMMLGSEINIRKNTDKRGSKNEMPSAGTSPTATTSSTKRPAGGAGGSGGGKKR